MTSRKIPGYRTTITVHSLDDADDAWSFEATIVNAVRARGGGLNVELSLGVILEPADASRLLMLAGGAGATIVEATTPFGVVRGLLDRADAHGAIGDAKHPSVAGATIELVSVKFTDLSQEPPT